MTDCRRQTHRDAVTKAARVLLGVACLSAAFVSETAATWRVFSSDATGVTAVWSTGPVAVDTVMSATAGQSGVTPTLALTLNGASAGGEAGSPAIPYITTMVAVPPGMVARATAAAAGYDVVRGTLTPTPEPVMLEDGLGFRLRYTVDPDAYAAHVDAPLIQIVSDGTLRGVELARVTLAPVRFNAAAGEARIAGEISVRIEFSGTAPDVVGKPGAGVPPFWRAGILNADAVAMWRVPTRVGRPAVTPSPFSSGTWLQVRVDETGMHRVTVAEATSADDRFSGAPIDRLGMFVGDGLQLPSSTLDVSPVDIEAIRPLISDLNGDGLFNGNDELIFHGRGLNRWHQEPFGDLTSEYVEHLHTTENVYWLAIVDSTALHAGTSDGDVTSSGLPVIDRYPHRVREGQETSNFNETSDVNFRPDGDDSGLDWEWDMLAVGATRDLTLSLRDVAGDTVYFSVGELRVADNPCQLLGVVLNGVPAAKVDSRTEGVYRSRQTFRATVSQGPEVQLPARLVNQNGSQFCGSDYRKRTTLDYYELEYWRTISVPNGASEYAFSLLPSRHIGPDEDVEVHVIGLDRTVHRLFDVTDDGLTEIALPAHGADGITRVRLQRSPLVEREYLAVRDQSWHEPARFVRATQRTDLLGRSGGVDYVVVTHEDFLADARRLAEWRTENDGFRTVVATTEDVYAQFSGGLFDPSAIRNFLAYAHENWRDDPNLPDLRYAVLIGDGHFNPRNIGRPAGGGDDPHYDNWIPTYQEGLITTDDWFASFSSSWIPHMQVGRLAVRSPDESRISVDKIVAYEESPERGAWQNRALILCDDEHNPDPVPPKANERFVRDCETISSPLRPETERRKIYAVEYPFDAQQQKSSAADDLIDAWNEGGILLNYIGHGSPTLWAHERLFVLSSDLPKLSNRSRLPILTALTCSAGHFDHPETQASAEVLVSAPNGGSVASVAATRLVFNNANTLFDSVFVRHLFRSSDRVPRVGDAFWAAKARWLPDVSLRTNTRKFVLIGDPAMRAALPELPVLVELDRDTLAALEPVTISGRVLTPDSSQTLTSFNGRVLVHVYDSDTRAKHDLDPRFGSLVYERPGLALFRGLETVVNGEFTLTGILPRELIYGGTEGRATAQVWNDQIDGAGGLQDVPISTSLGAVATDSIGPTIAFSLAGEPGETALAEPMTDGSEVPRGEPLRIWLTDPSGINVTGGIGHRLLVTLDGDDSDPIDLSGEFVHWGGATTGFADVALPIDVPVQRIAVRAWDNWNNVAADSILIRLSAREDVHLANIIAYPNPMVDDATTFTWITEGLGTDLADATVRIYTVAGRLVDTVSISDIADGPALLPWEPPHTLANGVYLYKISVRRQSDGYSVRSIERLAVLGR